MKHRFIIQTACLLVALLSATVAVAAEPLVAVEVTFSQEIHKQPFTGRVYLFFTSGSREPRLGPNWFSPEPFAAQDVKNWQPGQSLRFEFSKSPRVLPETVRQPGSSLLTFPQDLDVASLDNKTVQAVVRFSSVDRRVGTAAGNGYSMSRGVKVTSDGTVDPVSLTVDSLVPPRQFRETRWAKLLRVRSKVLSEFHGRDVFLQAAVILPASYYDQPDKRYPTIFTIPGFGGNHLSGSVNQPVPAGRDGVEFLRVLLNPDCYYGHHVFADSANNGPVGEAFITEFLLAYDAKFRTIPAPTARFLTGHSSGGWSSLWLQVTYPDHFGGVWSTAPDPVDFRDFQRINLYQPGENMYVDNGGKRRPLARVRGEVKLWYDDFDHMETVLGPGGQLRSFEAVFSPKAPDGTPLRVWDRKTGAVDTTAAKHWEKYDIRLILERNWKTLGPKLAGKLHVHMGTEDTFYLEGATRLLKESQEKLGSDAVIELHPGKDHGSLMTRELRDRIRSEISARFLESHPQ